MSCKVKMFSCFLIIAALVAPAESATNPAEGETGTEVSSATLPLAELLRLHKEIDRAALPEPEPAPVAATVTKMELEGRLLDDAVDLKAHFEVAVMAEDTWVKVPLFHKDKATHLSSLPVVADGEFVADDKTLFFVTDRKGRYAFDLALVKTARIEGRERRVSLRFENATLARLLVRYDEGLFRLSGGRALQESEGAVIYPEGNQFDLRWEQLIAVQERKLQAEVQRPPIESVITSAHASTVATLEGRRITRVLYQLRFEGTKSISFGIPDGLAVKKVYLNGAAVPFEIQGRDLALEVTPPRAGDQSARLELVLTDDLRAFHLSGRLTFAFPSASWNLDELYADLHLPPVFNYEWIGGSLAPASASPAVDFSHRIPTPGKRLRFHQHLIASSPDVEVDYTVDLAGKYFRSVPHHPAAVQPVQATSARQSDWTVVDDP